MEDKGRTMALDTSMQMVLNGKKVNTPSQSLFLKRRSMNILSPREQLKMTFHHKDKTSRARESFKMTLTHLKTNPKLLSSGFPRLLQVILQQVIPQHLGSPST
jgi:hypothetical protein